jgi:hypothetical protein
MVKAPTRNGAKARRPLPKGAQVAVLYGDPEAAARSRSASRRPRASRSAPLAPADEQVTIIDGDFHLSMGEAGSAHDADFGARRLRQPAGEDAARSDDEERRRRAGQFDRPFEINYVDPKDDPRKRRSTARLTLGDSTLPFAGEGWVGCFYRM